MNSVRGKLLRGRPRRPIHVVRLMVATLVVGACSTKHPPMTAVTTVATPTITVVSTTTVPPTTLYQPAAPQPSPDQASAHLIDAWHAGDRAAAAVDATPAAVAAVFAQPYPPGGVENRHCSNPVAGPPVCTFRILATGGLLQLFVVQGGGGWLTQEARFLSP